MAVRHGPRTGGAPWLTFNRQTAKLHIRAALLNPFTALGTPETKRVA